MVFIICPVYNASKFIGNTINSVRNQNRTDWRLVLVDDFSTDNTLEVIELLVAEDNRIIVLHTGKNSGPAHARNIGIDYAVSQSADYIAFIDSDDLYESQFLEVMLNSIEEFSADIVWCNYYEETYNKLSEKQLRQHGFFDGQELNAKEALACFLNETNGVGCLWNKLYRTSFVEQQNTRINEERVRAEDWEFNLMLFQQSSKIYTIDVPLYHYVHQERASVMATFRENDFLMYKRSLALLKQVTVTWKLENFMPKQYINFIYNSICFISNGIKSNLSKTFLMTVCMDSTLRDALYEDISWTSLTLKHKMYAYMLKHRLYSLLLIAMQVLK